VNIWQRITMHISHAGRVDLYLLIWTAGTSYMRTLGAIHKRMKSSIKLSVTILSCLIVGWLLNDTFKIYGDEFVKPIESSIDDSFFVFYQEFISDSTYQKAHITNPLKYEEWILEHMELYRTEQRHDMPFIKLPDINTSVFDKL
jgi:hypothetical protein